MVTYQKSSIEETVEKEKIDTTLGRYNYWSKDPLYNQPAYDSCSHCGGSCHGDGSCGGDGD